MFGTVDTGKGWKSQVCPRAIGGITTCHKMRHSLSLPTVTYICMGELPRFHHSPTTSFLHSQPMQAPPSGPGLVCAAGQMFIWDDPSVTPCSLGVPIYPPPPFPYSAYYTDRQQCSNLFCNETIMGDLVVLSFPGRCQHHVRNVFCLKRKSGLVRQMAGHVFGISRSHTLHW